MQKKNTLQTLYNETLLKKVFKKMQKVAKKHCKKQSKKPKISKTHLQKIIAESYCEK